MAALVYFVCGIPAGILRAWVVQRLWVWFVTPTFGISAPKIAVLYGLSWFIFLLWPMPKPLTQDDRESPAYNLVLSIVFSVFMSLVGLLVGFIANGIAA